MSEPGFEVIDLFTFHRNTNPNQRYASLQQWVSAVMSDGLAEMDEIYHHKSAGVRHVNSETFQFYTNTTGLSRGAVQVLDFHLKTGNTGDGWMFLTLVEMIGAGIKSYRPTVRECEALENIQVSIPMSEYAQPFPVLAVELPPEYVQSRTTAGLDDDGKPIQVSPVAIMSHLVKAEGCNALAINVLLHNGQSLSLCMRADPDMTVEKCIARYNSQPSIGENGWTLPTTQEERQLRHAMCRIACNACALLTNYGAKKLGYANPSHAARLERRIAKGGPHSNTNRMQLRVVPLLYGFEQRVCLFERSTEAGFRGESGHMLKPHWRRGHWRRFPGYREVEARGEVPKKVLIAAVLVNEHLLAGPKSATSTIYERAQDAPQ